MPLGDTVELGREMEVMGMVLMSIPKNRWEQINQFGVDGQTGMQLADRNEATMLAPPKHGERDGFRGRGRRQAYGGLEIQNDSSNEA